MGMKGMRMQTADQILQAIRKLGEQRQPLTRIYRCLFNPQLYLAAYNKIYRNQSALTPGTAHDTVDGMNLKRIRKIIAKLRTRNMKITQRQIIEANPDVNWNKLQIGQKIFIPGQ